MDNQQASRGVLRDRGQRGCLVEGCPCKDARIVSRRRTAFFAAWARDHGETADRNVAPDLEWRLPAITSPVASSAA